MDYLYKHRDHSRKLPFDVMNIIYEYADAMMKIRKQIANKNYDLDEIKYKRMIREIENNFINSNNEYEMIWRDNYIVVNPSNIHNIEKKHIISYYNYLFNITRQKRYKICGLDPDYLCSYRSSIIRSLEASGHKVNNKYSTKQLYKRWLKL
jgi:hypothetical protein